MIAAVVTWLRCAACGLVHPSLVGGRCVDCWRHESAHPEAWPRYIERREAA